MKLKVKPKIVGNVSFIYHSNAHGSLVNNKKEHKCEKTVFISLLVAVDSLWKMCICSESSYVNRNIFPDQLYICAAYTVQRMCSVCAVYVQRMCSVCAAYVQCMCSVCAAYVQRMCSVCDLPPRY